MKSSLAPLQRHVVPALLAFGAAWAVLQSDFAQRIENAVLDWQTRLRAEWRPNQRVPELLLVGIDELSLRTFEEPFGRWPWNRAIHGDLLQLMGLAEPSGPYVVTFDLLFTERSANDADFIAGLKTSQLDVVLGAERAKPAFGVVPGAETAQRARLSALPNVAGDRRRLLSADTMLLPAGELAQLAGIGFVDTPPGADGVRRQVPLVVRIGDTVYPTLSLQTLLRYWRAAPGQVQVRIGDAVVIETPGKVWRIPIDATGCYEVNYRHAVKGVHSVGYSDLYNQLLERYAQEKPTAVLPLAGRIVIIGQTADGLSDFGPTPLSAHTPLVLIHTNIIQNVLQEDYVRRVAPVVVWSIGLLLGIVSLAAFSERKVWQHVAFALSVPLAYLALATAAWVFRSTVFPVLGPILGFASVQVFMITRRVLAEQRAKEQIKSAFSTYLSPTLVDRLAASGAMPQLGGHEEEITAYFSDIQGYSGFSEKLPPAQLVELLNQYLTVCTDTITEEGGTLDKYIGDAVVAMFGAPIVLPDHAYRACLAALRVQQQLGTLRELWSREPDRWPEGVLKMQSRIGLNTGSATVGNMGSRSRFNYTMTGDNVNLAARMESGAKSWGVYTMCTQATKDACERHGGNRIVFRPLGRIVVMGRKQAVPIYEVTALQEHLTPSARECLALFSAALDHYHARDWSGAIAGFRRSAELEPNQPGKTPGVKNNPSLVYLDICAANLATPPPADWDGAYVMREK